MTKQKGHEIINHIRVYNNTNMNAFFHCIILMRDYNEQKELLRTKSKELILSMCRYYKIKVKASFTKEYLIDFIISSIHNRHECQECLELYNQHTLNTCADFYSTFRTCPICRLPYDEPEYITSAHTQECDHNI
jgi:hypothetical protein